MPAPTPMPVLAPVLRVEGTLSMAGDEEEDVDIDVDEGNEDDLIDDGTDGVCDAVDVALADDSSASGGAAWKVSLVGSRHEMVPSLRVKQHAQRAVVTL